MAKSSTGLEDNVAGLLCYLFGWITGLIFFLIEKDSKFVRFHAMQSIVVFGAISVAQIILSILTMIPVIGWIFGIIMWLIWVLALILWIILMVNAYQGKKLKLAISGDIAEKHA
jgi:uncharacterized membrane protein